MASKTHDRISQRARLRIEDARAIAQVLKHNHTLTELELMVRHTTSWAAVVRASLTNASHSTTKSETKADNSLFKHSSTITHSPSSVSWFVTSHHRLGGPKKVALTSASRRTTNSEPNADEPLAKHSSATRHSPHSISGFVVSNHRNGGSLSSRTHRRTSQENYIGAEGGQAIAEALEQNHTLTELDLCVRHVTGDGGPNSKTHQHLTAQPHRIQRRAGHCSGNRAQPYAHHT